MEVVIKLSPQSFEKLRAATPAGSKLLEVLESAARIEYAVDGVTFSGYEITCSHEQAQRLREIAKQYCPEASFDLEKALKAASPGKA